MKKLEIGVLARVVTKFIWGDKVKANKMFARNLPAKTPLSNPVHHYIEFRRSIKARAGVAALELYLHFQFAARLGQRAQGAGRGAEGAGRRAEGEGANPVTSQLFAGAHLHNAREICFRI